MAARTSSLESESESRATSDSSRSSLENGSKPRAAASLIGCGAVPDLMASTIWCEMAFFFQLKRTEPEGQTREIATERQITIDGRLVQLFLFEESALIAAKSRLVAGQSSQHPYSEFGSPLG
jgi:hypothetical protein